MSSLTDFVTPELTPYFKEYGCKIWKAPEKIVCAGVWFRGTTKYPNQYSNIEYGLVVAGLGHHNCMTILSYLFPNGEYLNHTVSGFLTSHRRFINRQDAWTIAEKMGQILHAHGAPGTLYSEDLFD